MFGSIIKSFFDCIFYVLLYHLMYHLMYHLRSQGIAAQDCVKVLIDEDNDDGTSKKSLYFGKCVAHDL